MSDSVIAAAKKEDDDLGKEETSLIARLEAVRGRRHELQEFLRIGKTLGIDSLPHFEPGAASLVIIPRRQIKEFTYKEIIESAAQKILGGGKWMGSRDLVFEMEKQGVQVRGDTIERKVLRVATILNRSDKFIAERGRGWALRQETLESPKGEARRAGTRQASVAV